MRVAKCKNVVCVGDRRDDPACGRKSNKLFLFSLVTILSIGDLSTSSATTQFTSSASPPSAQTSLESWPTVGTPPSSVNVKVNSIQDSRRTFPASVSILAQPPAVSSARVLGNPGAGQKQQQQQAKGATGENAVNLNLKSVLNSKTTENMHNWLRIRRSAAEESAAAPTMATTTTADSQKIGEFGDLLQVHNKMMKRNSENGGDDNDNNDGGRRDANLMRLLSQLIAAKQKMQHNSMQNQHGGDSFTSTFGGLHGNRMGPEFFYNPNNNHQPTDMEDHGEDEEYEEEDEAEDDQPMVLSISNINQIPPSERTKILRVAGTGSSRGGSGSFRSPSASDFAVEVADPIPLFASQHHLQSGGKMSRGMLRMRRRAVMRNPGYELPINEPTFFMLSSEGASRFPTPSISRSFLQGLRLDSKRSEESFHGNDNMRMESGSGRVRRWTDRLQRNLIDLLAHHIFEFGESRKLRPILHGPFPIPNEHDHSQTHLI